MGAFNKTDLTDTCHVSYKALAAGAEDVSLLSSLVSDEDDAGPPRPNNVNNT